MFELHSFAFLIGAFSWLSSSLQLNAFESFDLLILLVLLFLLNVSLHVVCVLSWWLSTGIPCCICFGPLLLWIFAHHVNMDKFGRGHARNPYYK